MANDFSGDAIALWGFEGQNGNDSIGGNNLTARGTPDYPAGKVGSYCLDVNDADNESLYRTDANMDAGFPGKSGVGDIDFSLCFWLNKDENGTTEMLIGKWGWTLDRRCWRVHGTGGGGNGVWFSIADGGVNEDHVVYGAEIPVGVWVHIGCTYDASENTLSMRIWRADTEAFVDAVTPTATNTSVSVNMSGADTPFEIGALDDGDTSYDFDGSLDEVVIFNRVLSDAEIDAIRSGTFPNTYNEALVEALGLTSCLPPFYYHFTRGQVASLATDNDDDLSTIFSCADYEAVRADDDSYVTLDATAGFGEYQFKVQHISLSDPFEVTVKPKSNVAFADSAVYLQILNRNSSTWETLDYDDSTPAGSEATLTGQKTSSLSNYIDANKWVSLRVYQAVG